MRKYLLLIAFVGTLSTSFAQDGGRPLSLKECVDIALEKNLRVKRSLFSVQTSNVNYWQSKMAMLPSLNVGGSYGQNFGRSINPVSNEFIEINNNTLNAQLTSSLLVFNGLRLQYALRQNKRDLDASNEDLQKAKNDVIINVVTLYINAIFNKELMENARYQLSSSQQQLDRIKKQVAAGSLPKANELNQEAQVATNEVTLVNQENALNLSILQLKQALQMPASEALDVVVPEIAVEDMVIDQTSEEVYQMALQEMPEIKSALYRVESAQLALRSAKGNYYPRLTLSGSATTNYSSANRELPTVVGVNAVPADPNTSAPIGFGSYSGFNVPVYAINYQPIFGDPEKYTQSEQMKDNLFKSLSLSLQIPIFNQWQSRGAVQRAAINTEVARISEIETQNTLRQSIETAYNDALAASKTYNSSVKQVNAREEAYRMNQQRFELGAVNFVEYQISENDLFQSRSDLTRAKYNFIFRKKILDFYQGKPIDY